MTSLAHELQTTPDGANAAGLHQDHVSDPESMDQEQLYRASAYGMLASLLRDVPNETLLQQVAALADSEQEEGDDMLMSMSALGLSARMHDQATIDDEFHDLFIGLGNGELSPYASWYLTGFLMEKPLSDLRDDLSALGFQRNEDVVEPEDHAGAVLEVMSMMIAEGHSLESQQAFFSRHISTWMDRFMQDLTQANASVFYRAVGRFGLAFMALEGEYLAMQS